MPWLGKVISDFYANGPEELSIYTGEVVQVIKDINKFWLHGETAGQSGNFPSRNVVKVEFPLIKSNQRLFAALEDYTCLTDGSLTFTKGDLIVETSKLDEHWSVGYLNGSEGVFPLSFVWEITIASKDLTLLDASFKYSKAKVLANVTSQLDDELSLQKGDIVILEEKVDDMWFRGSLGKRRGIIPSCVLEFIPNDGLESLISEGIKDPVHSVGSCISQPFKSHNNSEDNSSGVDKLIDIPSITDSYAPSFTYFDSYNSGIKAYGRSLYSFTAQHPRELSFSEGEIIYLTSHLNDQWMEGEVNGKIGIFPKAYVDIIVDCIQSDMKSDTTVDLLGSIEDDIFNQNSQKPICFPSNTYGKSLYDLKAIFDGDLNLKAGEILHLLERVNKDWLKAENALGQIGLCPQNYVSILELRDTNELQDFDNYLQSNLPNHIPEHLPTEIHNLEVLPSNFHPVKSNSESHSDNYADTFSETLREFDVLLHKKEKMDNHMQTSFYPATDFIQDTSLRSMSKIAPHRPAPPVPSKHRVEKVDSGHFRLSCTKGVDSFEPDHLYLFDSTVNQLEQALFDVKELELELDMDVKTGGHQSGLLRKKIEMKSSLICSCRQSLAYLIKNTNLENNRISKAQTLGVECNPPKSEEEIMKDAELRQHIIEELMSTENEFHRDMKVTYDTYSLNDPFQLHRRGIDTMKLFGNLIEIITVSKQLINHLQIACSTKHDSIIIGQCFISLKSDIQNAFLQYCVNHDNVTQLLEKYSYSPEANAILEQGLHTLKKQVVCFNLGSILIKPVQRILKYPLILNNLLKHTSQTHPDHEYIVKAIAAMTIVATQINEAKRRKELVLKYRQSSELSISDKLARLSLHSMAKKSSRIGWRLSNTLGITSLTKDEAFEDEVQKFLVLDKLLRSALTNFKTYEDTFGDVLCHNSNILEGFAPIYSKDNSTEMFAPYKYSFKVILTRHWEDFKIQLEKIVMAPLQQLKDIYNGPLRLIEKREDKLLDYESCSSKLEKNKDYSKTKQLSEELHEAKANYEALNQQLLEELPKLCEISLSIIEKCFSSYVCLRKKLLKESLNELIFIKELNVCQKSALESFVIKHSLIISQISKIGFVPKPLISETLSKEKKSKLDPKTNSIPLNKKQVESVKQKLVDTKPLEELYYLKEAHDSTDDLHLTLEYGSIVHVLKKQDPMGSEHRWFVSDGNQCGFVTTAVLAPLDIAMMKSFGLQIPQTASLEIEPVKDITCLAAENIRTRAKHPFTSFGPDQLSVNAGEEIRLIMNDPNSAWWFVENRLGQQGYVPRDYLEP